jgi:hypothetical protein
MRQVDAILAETDPTKTVAAVLGQHGGDRKSEKAKADQPDNHKLEEYGTGRNYTLARLRRDRPDLAARVRAGELSANAAAIEAGFRKPRSAYADLCAAWRRAAPEDRDRARVGRTLPAQKGRPSRGGPSEVPLIPSGG